jgi:hypothetical protein
MTNGGRWFDKHKGYHRQKFTCRLINLRTKHKCGTCPINHPKFHKNGCYRYLNLDDQDQLRFTIHRDSQEYKTTFKQRTSVEQAFLYIKEHYDIEVPHVRNLNSVKNISTIAAILNVVKGKRWGSYVLTPTIFCKLCCLFLCNAPFSETFYTTKL